MRVLPKPDLHKLVDVIRELTEQAYVKVPGADQNVLRSLIVSAVERGIDLQREVLLSMEEATPLIPPPTEPPPADPKIPKAKLPRGC